MSDSANDIYRDAALRNAVSLRRYSLGLARRVANLMAEVDADLSDLLTARLRRFEGEGRTLDWTGERWKKILLEIGDTRTALIKSVQTLVLDELRELSKVEATNELDTLQSSIPVEISFTEVPADQLRAVVSAKPFQGRLLKDWFAGLEELDRGRLVRSIQLGIVEGQTTPDIVRRLTGTKANAYKDGILSISRREAVAVVRTAINHVSNLAREYVWDANADIILAKVWVSTLDGRTTPVCRARDGHASPMNGRALPPELTPLKPPNARPPAHIGCRSTMAVVISPEGLLGNRPFVVDTRTPDQRRVDFRQEAKAQGKTEKAVREAWGQANIGRVPATTTYQDFLQRQTAKFQDEVLGPTRGKLFRTGQIKLDEYVDRAGNELTLAQLAARRPEVFKAAGVSLPE